MILRMERGDTVVAVVSHMGYLVIATKYGEIFRVSNIGDTCLVEAVKL